MTQEQIIQKCDELKTFLLQKNEKYGDAALAPLSIFNKGDASNSICIRIDDKLNRIINSNEGLRKNDVADLTGYLILLMISKDWNLDDLID